MTEVDTNNDIAELRQKVLDRVEQLDNDEVDINDVQRWKNDDTWVHRFCVHNYQDLEHATTMAIECMQWRKKLKVNSITEKSLSKTMMKAGGIYIGTEDKSGNKILMFHGKLHHKDGTLLPEQKKIIIYWMEKLEKEYANKKVTVVFDMSDTGFGNMDMEIIKFIINLFKYYYPNCLAYILVFELPWILNAGWKIIKTWLSARAVDKIKFVTRTSIQDYIASEELLGVMGGSSTFEYAYEESNGTDSPSTSDTEPTESTTTAKKKVHFANDTENSQDNEDEVKNHVLVENHFKHPDGSPNGCLLRISPSDELIFAVENSGDSSGTLFLMNNTEQCVAFKVKTTSPEKFRVRPSSGTIKPMCCVDVVVQLQMAYQNSSLVRDKFLIMAMEIDQDEVAGQELLDMWKKSPKDKIMEHKLRCSLSLPSPAIVKDDIIDSPVRKVTNNHSIPINVMQELDKLHKRICSLHRLIVLLTLMTLTLLIVTLTTLSLLWQQSQSVFEKSSSELFCNAINAEKTMNDAT